MPKNTGKTKGLDSQYPTGYTMSMTNNDSNAKGQAMQAHGLRWRQTFPRQFVLLDASESVLGSVYGIVGSCNRPTGSWRHSMSEAKFGSCKAAAAALLKKIATKPA